MDQMKFQAFLNIFSFSCMFWGLRLRFLESPSPSERNPRTAVCPVICIAPMAFIEGFYKCLCWSAHFHPSIPDIPNIKEKYQEVQHCLEFQILKDTFCSLLHCLKLFLVATCKSVNQYIWTSKYASCEWCPKNMNQRAIDRFQIKHSKSM